MDRSATDNASKPRVRTPPASALRPLLLAAFGAAVCAFAFAFAAPAGAEEPRLFIPDDLRLFQPLESDPRGANAFAHLLRGLDNQALEQTAAELRSNRMSSTHRALNHQWLEQHHTGEMDRGRKVVSRLLKAMVKSYWNEWRDRRLADDSAVPDASGRGKIHYGGHDLDYKLRLKRDEISFEIKYEF